jgi:hypothetical protein
MDGDIDFDEAANLSNSAQYAAKPVVCGETVKKDVNGTRGGANPSLVKT